MYTLDKECPVCGTYFTGRRDKQFCSGRCRVTAHRQRGLSDESEEEEECTDAYEQPVTETNREADVPWQKPASRAGELHDRTHLNLADEETDVADIIQSCFTQYRMQEAAAQRARQQQANAVVAQQIHVVYVKAIEDFLQWEGQRLAVKNLQELADSLLDAKENYKTHPYLTQPAHVAQLRLDDLRDALLIVRKTQQEAMDSWLGRTGCYELKGKWRKQLRKRLLE